MCHEVAVYAGLSRHWFGRLQLLEPDARGYLEKDERFARGMTFEEFSQLIELSDLVQKTTLIVW